MSEKTIFVFAVLIPAALLLSLILFYAKLFVVNAIRRWLPDGSARQTLLTGSEEVPTVREHFGATKRMLARFLLAVMFFAGVLGVMYGIVSIAIAMPLWGLILILLLLLG